MNMTTPTEPTYTRGHLALGSNAVGTQIDVIILNRLTGTRSVRTFASRDAADVFIARWLEVAG